MRYNIDAFRGTGVAVVTPFNKDGSFDFPALERVLNHLIDNGVDYLVSLGTTGEYMTLSLQERYTVLDATVEMVNGRVPIVAGFGAADTAYVIECMQGYHMKGIDGVLSSSPSYVKPSQEGLYQHYKAVAGGTDLPLILYNVPSRTSRSVSADTTLRLAEIDNIVGIKEASNDFAICNQLLKYRPDDFLLISGDDLNAFPLIALGFDGVISVVANATPAAFGQLIRHALAGELQQARKLQYQLSDFINLLFEDCNPSGIKAAVAELGLIQNSLRLPLVPVSEDLESRIAKELQAIMSRKV